MKETAATLAANIRTLAQQEEQGTDRTRDGRDKPFMGMAHNVFSPEKQQGLAGRA